jgi:hypothetical protein
MSLDYKRSVCLYKRDNRKTNQARIYIVNINKKNICFTYQYYIVCVATGNNCHTLKHAALDLRSAHTQYKETTQLIVLKIVGPSPKCAYISAFSSKELEYFLSNL